MLSFFDPFRGIVVVAILIRMVLACLCGTVVGLERSSKNRPAGFRTHILVCVGTTIAALTGLYLYMVDYMPADVSRISAQVISGLGFIGAGTIIVTKKQSVKGLTTAAGLWTTGIVGLAIGSGYYELAIAGSLLVLFVESWFFTLGGRIQHNHEYTLELTYQKKGSLDSALRVCKNHHMSITNLRIHTQESAEESADEKNMLYTAEVALSGSTQPDEMLDLIRQMPGVTSAIIQ